MQRYMIETPHTQEDCLGLLDEINAQGYLAHLDWGCYDGVHIGWAVIEAENLAQARLAVPPLARTKARVVRLNKFTAGDMAKLHAKKTAVAQTTC